MHYFILLCLLIAACSAERSDHYEQQRKSDDSQSDSKSSDNGDSQTQPEETISGTAPMPASPPATVPNLPPAGTWKASTHSDCDRIGCYIDQSNAAAVHVYGEFDLNKDNCLNKKEAMAHLHEKCLTTKRRMEYLTCPVTKYNQPIRGAWQARCYFEDVTTCSCEIL